MLTETEIKNIVMQALDLHEAIVRGDGSHFEIIAVDDRFAQMSRVQKQQFIFAPLARYIADNTIHALSIKTFTLAEWQRHCLLNGQ